METLKYLAGACWAWLVDWIVPKWQSLKAKTTAALHRARARNTGDK